jgi:2-iminobutanoate/2-iminopropanoate deaminase
MANTTIRAEGAPRALGPYSHGVRTGDFVFTSGQVGLDPATGTLVPGGIEAETRRTFQNLRAVLEAGGSGLDRVVKTSVYLVDLDEFAAMNAVYATFFPGDKPARTTVQVSRLPAGARVEIDAVGTVER